MRKKILISIGIFLSCFSAQAYFESITVWRNPTTGQLVYCVGDAHGFRVEGWANMLNYEAQRGIRSVLTRIWLEKKQQDFLALVEDTTAYKGKREALKKYMEAAAYVSWHGDDDHNTPLVGIMDELKSLGIPAINTEYRFLRCTGIGFIDLFLLQHGMQKHKFDSDIEDRKKEAGTTVVCDQGLDSSISDDKKRGVEVSPSIGHIVPSHKISGEDFILDVQQQDLSDPQEKMKALYKSLQITGHDIVEEYNEAASEIDKYSDPLLRGYYKATLKVIRQASAGFLDSVSQDHEGIVEYFKSHFPVEHRKFFNDSLGSFDARLLEARMLHHMVECAGVKKVLMLCGAVHSYQIGCSLESLLHYKRVAHVGIDTVYEDQIIDFNPLNPIKFSMCDDSALTYEQYKIIYEDEPERFSAGSFS